MTPPIDIFALALNHRTSFFEWLNGQLISRSVGEIRGLCEVIEKILSTLTITTTPRFLNSIERLNKLLALMVTAPDAQHSPGKAIILSQLFVG
jgi:hypothetical protein